MARPSAAHMPAMDTIKFLDTNDVAELLKISPRTVEGWRVENNGPTYRKIGRHIRYELGDILDWARSG